jgi:hypothetical protein
MYFLDLDESKRVKLVQAINYQLDIMRKNQQQAEAA